MLNLEDALYIPKAEDILAKISELDIFERYCTPFKEIDKSFCSELREDTKPDCRIFLTNGNQYKYKDFATGECLNAFQYIMKKYSVNYSECLKIIVNDFKLGIIKTDINPGLLIGKLEIREKKIFVPQKAEIQIVSQPFTLVDYNYWNQYGISLEKLQEFDVFSCSHVYLRKGDKSSVYLYNKKNPMFAYRFEKEGKFYYKIYWPLAEKGKKWLFSGYKENLEGYDQLPLNGDILVLTKSLKDVICYNLIGYPAISLQGESNKLEWDTLEKLKKRFNRIVCNYDSDEHGYQAMNKIYKDYNLMCYSFEEAKDLSDLIKLKGLDYSKKLVDNLING